MDSTEYQAAVEEACTWLAERISPLPKRTVIAGTGLGRLVDIVEQKAVFLYSDIPQFPTSTVPSHAGKLIWGELDGRPILIMQGRFHLYEGYSAAQAVFPIRTLARAGTEELIVTNAAGGLNPDFSAGDIMLITDHINFMGENPLVGAHKDAWGPRFPDMSAPYDSHLRQLAISRARQLGIPLRQGVYVGVKGPSLETQAETRLFRALGADAIGMSTIPEVIAAVQSGLRVLGFSVLSNMNIPGQMAPVALDDIIATAETAAEPLAELIRAVAAAS